MGAMPSSIRPEDRRTKVTGNTQACYVSDASEHILHITNMDVTPNFHNFHPSLRVEITGDLQEDLDKDAVIKLSARWSDGEAHGDVLLSEQGRAHPTIEVIQNGKKVATPTKGQVQLVFNMEHMPWGMFPRDVYTVRADILTGLGKVVMAIEESMWVEGDTKIR